MLVVLKNGELVEMSQVDFIPPEVEVDYIVLRAKDLQEMKVNRRSSNINDLYIDSWAKASEAARPKLGEE